MRVGITPVLNDSAGGIYQYSLTMLHSLHQWTCDGCTDEFVIFAHQMHHPTLAGLNGRNWTLKPRQPPSLQKQALSGLRRLVGEGPHREAWRWLRRKLSEVDQQGNGTLPNPDVVRYRPDMKRWFHRCRVDLMLYPAPNALSFETGFPCVMAVHDLQHRLQPEFPEVSANGEWELREYIFRNGTRHATLLLADSEVGKEDILNFYGPYGVTSDRVKVLPFLPACYLRRDISEGERRRVRRAYHLPERYLFYPAQFWPHKNHGRIVQALGLLKQEHSLKIPVVFCGSYTGEIRERTFQEVMALSSQLGIEKEVYYLGYVPDEDMSGLYAEAVALVMPTFFGPTNIPVLEAWAFGCPVLSSDIRGIREQVKDAALLVDPRSMEAIADGIYQLWTDEKLPATLIALGHQRLASYTPDDYRRRLVSILEEAKARIHS
jgi:glycosyltransferase involved in cell wall biosynthesis